MAGLARSFAALLVAAGLACAPGMPPSGAPPEPVDAPPPGPSPGLPPVPERTGPLALDLVYPPEDASVVTDSTFVFGSAGTGEARVAVNGADVAVAPNGAFLAFLPVPADGVYRLRAEAAGGVDTLTREVTVQSVEAADPAVVVLAPRGTWALRRGEPLRVRLRGPPGGSARLVLPDSSVVPLRERSVSAEPEAGFMRDAARPTELVEYEAVLPATLPLAPADTAVAPSELAPPPPTAGTAVVELALAHDTTRVPLDVSLGLLEPAEMRWTVAAAERVDETTIGVAAPPPGSPYHWFFPNGTLLPVTGERAGMARVRLTEELSVWVPSADVRPLAPGTGPDEASVGAVRVVPGAEVAELRIAASAPLPFHVDARDDELTLIVYGARSRTNWMYQPTEGDFVRALSWEQAGDEWRLRVELAEPLWGWLADWAEDGRLVLRLRRPPAVDPGRPLAGVHVAVDAGHPPGGAIGPTRLTEAEANLEVARRLAALLRERGARVLEIRPDTAAVALGERPQMATDSSVHVLLSIHNNAFPDGVDPFENAGTSVLYNRPQSLPLARLVQRELLAELGLRDLGVIWADLALARPTWMPSVLSESMFLMVPEQEAALRDAEVLERVARAHVRALEAFLRERGRVR